VRGKGGAPSVILHKTQEAPAPNKGRSMLREVVERVSFFSVLYRIDEDLAQRVRECGCERCGGMLHSGGYIRKARGSPIEIPEQYSKRMSFCCSEEGCRARTLPPSCLFMGRRVYWGPIVLLVVGLRQGRVEGFTAEKIQKKYGIRRNTLRRWMRYYREEFPQTDSWRRLRGRVVPSIEDGDVWGLIEHFVSCHGDSTDGFVSVLVFLAGGEERAL
jgi:hypothetical protein